jgi:hypothetical protein
MKHSGRKISVFALDQNHVWLPPSFKVQCINLTLMALSLSKPI